MSGWIKLHRQIVSSSKFSDPDILRLWILCLTKATHKDNVVVIDRQEIPLVAGQFITGRFSLHQDYNAALSPRKRIKDTTLWSWLKRLEEWGDLDIKSTNKYSVVTVLKWSEYQEALTTEPQQIDNKLTTEPQQIDTNKNVKNLENSSSSVVVDNNEPKTAMDAYIFCFKKLHYNGFISNYVVELMKKGMPDSFIREVFMQMGENGVTEPNVMYMKKVAEDWIKKGISSRSEALKDKESQKEGGNVGGTKESIRQGSSTGTVKPSESSQSGVLPSKWFKVGPDGELQVSGLQG